MPDFPRPFSGNKNKKKKKAAKAAAKVGRLVKSLGENEGLRKATELTRKALPDVVKNIADRTREMGGPNMETPLDKALVGNQKNLNEGLRKAIEAAPENPVKMISTGVAGVDPMSGMPQANQLAPSPINPRALGSMQPQIPSITGQPVAGAYDRVMPAPAQTGLAAPLQHKMKRMHIHPTEFTGKIQTKPDGQEYSLIELDGNQKVPDTLQPAGLKFGKGIVKDGYLEGSQDLPAFKTGDKTFTLNINK